jgi:hypothetical protein
VQKVVIEQTITEEIIAAKQVNRVVVAEPTATLSNSRFAVLQSERPKQRPRGLRVAILDSKPGKVEKPVVYRKGGSVCGISGIRGYSVKPIGRKAGCGISAPVKVSEVDGIPLTREALVNCDAAKALYNWVQKKAKPTIGRKGGGLAKVQLIGGYSCRTRNSRTGARLSEHSKGNAVDIAGFILKDGTTMSVVKDFRKGRHSSTMKQLHKSACGTFGTVLGPKSDRHHQDHFHFDVAKHRGGAYCR